MLSNVKFIQEKKVIKKYFDDIAADTGKICFGVEDTMKCLDSGAIETLLLYENLEHWRVTLKNPSTQVDVPMCAREREAWARACVCLCARARGAGNGAN